MQELLNAVNPHQMKVLEELHDKFFDRKHTEGRKLIIATSAYNQELLKGNDKAVVPKALNVSRAELTELFSLRAQMIGILLEVSNDLRDKDTDDYRKLEALEFSDDPAATSMHSRMAAIIDTMSTRRGDIVDDLQPDNPDYKEIPEIKIKRDIVGIVHDIPQFTEAFAMVENSDIDTPEQRARKERTRRSLLHWQRNALLIKEINPMVSAAVDAGALRERVLEKPIRLLVGVVASILAIMAILTLIKKKGQMTETDLLITGSYVLTAITTLGLHQSSRDSIVPVAMKLGRVLSDPDLRKAIKNAGIQETYNALDGVSEFFEDMDEKDREKFAASLDPTKVATAITEMESKMDPTHKPAFQKAFIKSKMSDNDRSVLLLRLYNDEIWEEATVNEYKAILITKKVVKSIQSAK